MSQNVDLHIQKNKYIYHKRYSLTIKISVEVGKPEDWTASESARQAATDKLPFSMCSEPKIFSKMGQKTLSSESIESSATGSVATDIARWLNTVPILNLKDYIWEKEQTQHFYSVKYKKTQY